jgi:hypothetical protein
MLQVASGEATRGSGPSIRGGQVVEIQGSHRTLEVRKVRAQRLGAPSRVAKCREPSTREHMEKLQGGARVIDGWTRIT